MTHRQVLIGGLAFLEQLQSQCAVAQGAGNHDQVPGLGAVTTDGLTLKGTALNRNRDQPGPGTATGVPANEGDAMAFGLIEGAIEKCGDVSKVSFPRACQADIEITGGAPHGGNIAQVDSDSLVAKVFAVSPAATEMNLFNQKICRGEQAVSFRETEFGGIVTYATTNPLAIDHLLADTLNQLEFAQIL